MATEIKINDRFAWAELLKQDGNLLRIRIDDKIYDIDLMHTNDGTFSIIVDGNSFNIELVPAEQPKKYTAHTLYQAFDVDIIDAEARYLINRGGGHAESGEKNIFSPMPGKVVKIMLKEGDAVSKGQIVVVLSAMKMESEYKSSVDGIIKRVAVNEGDTVEGNQILIEIE